GAITNLGAIDVTADSSINNDLLGNNALTVETGKTLTLNGTTVTRALLDALPIFNVAATKTLTLNGVALTGGAITNSGAIDVTADGSINNDLLANNSLTVETGKTLTLNGTTLTGGTITDSGTVKVAAGSTLTLNGV